MLLLGVAFTNRARKCLRLFCAGLLSEIISADIAESYGAKDGSEWKYYLTATEANLR